jgi:hypothetical protein
MTTIESTDADEEAHLYSFALPRAVASRPWSRACARRPAQGLARRCTAVLHSKSERISESFRLAAMSSGGFRFISELSTSYCQCEM